MEDENSTINTLNYIELIDVRNKTMMITTQTSLQTNFAVQLIKCLDLINQKDTKITINKYNLFITHQYQHKEAYNDLCTSMFIVFAWGAFLPCMQ